MRWKHEAGPSTSNECAESLAACSSGSARPPPRSANPSLLAGGGAAELGTWAGPGAYALP